MSGRDRHRARVAAALRVMLGATVLVASACNARVDGTPMPERRTCVAACGARVCGDDGCGGTCGSCSAGVCSGAGTCEASGELWVPTRDGVELATYVTLPSKAPGQQFPIVLLRSTDAQRRDGTFSALRKLSGQGYAFVYQDVRGTGRSRGTLRPMVQEFADGQDTVRYLVRQPWSNGKVVTVGSGYEGFAALAAAVDTPEVVSVIAEDYPSDGFASWPLTQNGVARADLLRWLRGMRGESVDDGRFLSLSSNHRPYRELDRAIFGREDLTWRTWAREPGVREEVWDAARLRGRFAQICASVLHIATRDGLSDPVDGYEEMAKGACGKARLVVADRGHTVRDLFELNAVSDEMRTHLATSVFNAPEPPDRLRRVSAFVQGSQAVVTDDTWPLARASTVLFLSGADAGVGALAGDVAEVTADTPHYVFDPQRDDACTGAMQGLSFLSAPLSRAERIVGAPTLEVDVAIDTPDTDLMAYLYEVTWDGNLQPFASAKLRLRFRDSYAAPQPMTPGKTERVRLTFGTVGYAMPMGSRLLLHVNSTECGAAENPNTGASIGDAVATRAVKIELRTGLRGSKVTLPLMAQ
jgi:hypothetical protein